PKNAFNELFAAWPLRFYVLDGDRVSFIGEPYGAPLSHRRHRLLTCTQAQRCEFPTSIGISASGSSTLRERRAPYKRCCWSNDALLRNHFDATMPMCGW